MTVNVHKTHEESKVNAFFLHYNPGALAKTDVIVSNENSALIKHENTIKYKFCRQFVMNFVDDL